MLENSILRTPVEKIRAGYLTLLPSGLALEWRQCSCVWIRQSSQHDAVDDAEDRRARADARRERDDPQSPKNPAVSLTRATA